MCKQKTMVNGYGVDACIAPIVKALNEAGVETVASCCGHGNFDAPIVLYDGREVRVLPADDERVGQYWSFLLSVDQRRELERVNGLHP